MRWDMQVVNAPGNATLIAPGAGRSRCIVLQGRFVRLVIDPTSGNVVWQIRVRLLVDPLPAAVEFSDCHPKENISCPHFCGKNASFPFMSQQNWRFSVLRLLVRDRVRGQATCTSQLAHPESIGVVQMNSQELSTNIAVSSSLLESLGSDRALLRELIGMFLEDCPKQLESIRDAVQRRDAVALRSAAHLLRGCVGNFGMSAAYDAARRLENMGREGNWTDVEARCACLESELQRLEVALAQLIRAGIPLCVSEVSR